MRQIRTVYHRETNGVGTFRMKRAEINSTNGSGSSLRDKASLFSQFHRINYAIRTLTSMMKSPQYKAKSISRKESREIKKISTQPNRQFPDPAAHQGKAAGCIGLNIPIKHQLALPKNEPHPHDLELENCSTTQKFRLFQAQKTFFRRWVEKKFARRCLSGISREHKTLG